MDTWKYAKVHKLGTKEREKRKNGEVVRALDGAHPMGGAEPRPLASMLRRCASSTCTTLASAAAAARSITITTTSASLAGDDGPVRRRPPPAIAATLPSTNNYKTFTAHEIKTFVCHSLPSTRNFVAPCLRGSTLVLPPPLFYRHLQTRLVMRSALSHFSSTDAGRRVAVASSEMGTDRRRRSAQGFPHKVTHTHT